MVPIMAACMIGNAPLRAARCAPTMCTATPADADPKALLLSLAARRTTAAEKEAALASLMASDARDAVLDEALQVIDNETSLLSRRRWPLPLPSRRAALGSYSRLLAELAAEEQGSSERFTDGGVRRRFLLVLLRQLRGANGVWALERVAQKRKARATSSAEMLERTPEGLETPEYDVIDSREAAGWEVRRYAEFSVVTTARDRAVAADGMKLGNPTMRAAGGFQVRTANAQRMLSGCTANASGMHSERIRHAHTSIARALARAR